MKTKQNAQALANTRQWLGSGLVDELKRVSWPSRQETIRLTSVVILISLIIGLYIGIIDLGLAKLLEVLSKR